MDSQTGAPGSLPPDTRTKGDSGTRAASSLAGPEKIGRYQILDELGRGAMGRVYRAFDPNIGRQIALKAIPLDSGDPELGARFRREAQAAGILSHPNIVTIYDAGEDDGFLYIAMELVEGETIQQIALRGPLPLEQVIAIGEQAGAALDHAHARAIVHRDVKPANIMLQRGHVKVTDFGIAKINTAGMTTTGQVVGTPAYLAPEVVKGSTATARSDIFSLGVVLYELLTGAKAFSGDNLTTIIYRVISEQPSPPTLLLPTLPPGVNYVISRALVKNPDGRYATCADLVADLKNHAALAEKGRALAAGSALEEPAPRAPSRPASVQPAAPGVSRRRPRSSIQEQLRSPGWRLAAVAAALAAIFLVGWVVRQNRPPAASDTAAQESPPSSTKESTAPPPSRRAAIEESARPSPFGADGESNATSTGTPQSGQFPELASATASDVAPLPQGAMGRVVVHTDPPGARILVNGKDTSYRSPVNFALAAGEHEIAFEYDGFSRTKRTVVIQADHTVRVHVELERRRGFLSRIPFIR